PGSGTEQQGDILSNAAPVSNGVPGWKDSPAEFDARLSGFRRLSRNYRLNIIPVELFLPFPVEPTYRDPSSGAQGTNMPPRPGSTQFAPVRFWPA
ncbi:MAG: hypothetical protein VXZ53_17815, partial [Planctomycetota bacterium]|nr:hypothetical protein [Planctomycetota bacterium]